MTIQKENTPLKCLLWFCQLRVHHCCVCWHRARSKCAHLSGNPGSGAGLWATPCNGLFPGDRDTGHTVAAPVPGEQLVSCRTPTHTYPAPLGLCPDMSLEEGAASERESWESRDTASGQQDKWLLLTAEYPRAGHPPQRQRKATGF